MDELFYHEHGTSTSCPPTSSHRITPSLLDMARSYYDAGLCPLPRIRGHDGPTTITPDGAILALTWSQYKVQRPDWFMVASWFAHGHFTTCGITLLTGSHAQPRGQQAAFLQILDIETSEVFDALQESIAYNGHAAIWHRCTVERTPSGGAHVGFLCTVIDDKHKHTLARRASDNKILIELLQHHPCTVAPTRIRCKPTHPEGGVYQLVQGTWAKPLEISPEQRRVLIETARSFNEIPAKTVHGRAANARDGTRPGDQLNAQADAEWWRELLAKHGWRDVSRSNLKGQGLYYFQRPGKVGRAPSATYGKTGDCLYVFSSNALPFDAETAYSPFAAFALLEHEGDWGKAAKALAQQGYGTPKAKPGYEGHWMGPRETWCGIPKNVVIKKVVING